jgi:hypothetical protein
MTVLKQVDVESMTWVRCRWASPPALYAVCADKEKGRSRTAMEGGRTRNIFCGTAHG